jgi:hypothetical protein
MYFLVIFFVIFVTQRNEILQTSSIPVYFTLNFDFQNFGKKFVSLRFVVDPDSMTLRILILIEQKC